MTGVVLDEIAVQAENVKEKVIKSQVVDDLGVDQDHGGPDLGPDQDLDPEAPDIQNITVQMTVIEVNQSLVHPHRIP